MKVELAGVSKDFGRNRAVDGVSEVFEPGKIVAVLGLNGAGKSTLLHCLAGICGLSAGEIYFDGEPFERERGDLRRRFGFLPDFPAFFPSMSGVEHIAMALRLYDRDTSEAQDLVLDLLRSFDVLSVAEAPLSTLSRGQAYKIALAALIAANPELWILDEPMASGMDALGLQQFRARARAAAEAGATILYTTQILSVAEQFSDEVLILHEGRVRRARGHGQPRNHRCTGEHSRRLPRRKMNLYDRKFLGELRRRGRREAKPKLLWRIAAARRWMAIVARLALLAAAVGYLNLLPGKFEVRGPILVLILWASTLGLSFSNTLGMIWRSGPKLGAWAQLPLTSRQIWEYFVTSARTSLSWVALDALAILWLVSEKMHLPFGAWLGLMPVAALVSVSTMAFGILCGHKWVRAVSRFVFGIVFLFGSLIVITLPVRETRAAEDLARLGFLFAWSLPPGWACQFAEWIIGLRTTFPSAAVALLVLSILLAILSLRAFAARYQFWQKLDFQSTPGFGGAAVPEPAASPPVRTKKMEHVHWTQSWLERWLRSGSVRQRAVLDFLVEPNSTWARLYYQGLALILLAALCDWAINAVIPVLAPPVVGILLLVSARYTLLLGVGDVDWRAFKTRRPSGWAPPTIALFPVPPREIHAVVFRFNFRRMLAALPPFLLAGIVGARSFHASLFNGASIAALVWLILLLALPSVFVFRLSAGTNDSRGFWRVCAVPLPPLLAESRFYPAALRVADSSAVVLAGCGPSRLWRGELRFRSRVSPHLQLKGHRSSQQIPGQPLRHPAHHDPRPEGIDPR